jgi:hypothetical protein
MVPRVGRFVSGLCVSGYGFVRNKFVTEKWLYGGGKRLTPDPHLGAVDPGSATLPNERCPLPVFTRTGESWPRLDVA